MHHGEVNSHPFIFSSMLNFCKVLFACSIPLHFNFCYDFCVFLLAQLHCILIYVFFAHTTPLQSNQLRSCCGPSKMVLGCVCWNFRFYQQSLSLEFLSLYEKVTERHLFAINHEQLKGIWTYSLGKMVIHCCHSLWCHINKLGYVTWFLKCYRITNCPIAKI